MAGIASKVLQRILPLEGPYPLTALRLVEALGGGASGTGVRVSPASALSIASVYACVRVLTDSVASLPLLVYRRLVRGKERAVEHPAYRLLHEEPNPWMTPFQVKETLMGHVLLWGNAYAEIDRDGFGNPIALWPLRPQDMIRIERAQGGELLYYYQVPRRKEAGLLESPGDLVVLPQRSVFHLRGFSSDGLRGYSPITLHREALGLALAAEQFGAKFFANSAVPRGVLQSKGRLSAEAAARLRQTWNEGHQGLTEAQRVAVLEEGVEWHATGMPLEDAQFILTRQYQRTEIAAIYRVPPHKIGDLSRATYSNIDRQEQAWRSDSLGPWLVRIEEQVGSDLMARPDRRDYFAEFLMDAELRADIRTRYDAYFRGRQGGWLSGNDIREKENLNAIPGLDDYWIPLNVGAQGVEPEPSVTEADVRALLATVREEEDEDERRAILERVLSGVDRLLAEQREISQRLAMPSPPPRASRRRRVERDEEGRISAVVEE